MKTTTKLSRFLHAEAREYRGLRRVRAFKTLASRAERRAVRLAIKNETH